jgi:threonine dehydrogenase-like Zn-dependent dehydrogenase
MAALVLSTATHRLRSDTPAHLRSQLPAPVDFSSHLKPPTKVSDNQVLVQVYAVAIDGFDLAVLDVKSRADVGKWVPGRSFVGRCLQVGSYEKELVRGDLIMGLCDVRKVSLYSIRHG